MPLQALPLPRRLDRLEAPLGTGLHELTVQPKGKEGEGARFGKKPRVTPSARQDAATRDLSDVRLGQCPCCGTVRGGELLREAVDALPEALRVNSAHMVPPFAVRLCDKRDILEGEGKKRLVLMAGSRAAVPHSGCATCPTGCVKSSGPSSWFAGRC